MQASLFLWHYDTHTNWQLTANSKQTDRAYSLKKLKRSSTRAIGNSRLLLLYFFSFGIRNHAMPTLQWMGTQRVAILAPPFLVRHLAAAIQHRHWMVLHMWTLWSNPSKILRTMWTLDRIRGACVLQAMCHGGMARWCLLCKLYHVWSVSFRHGRSHFFWLVLLFWRRQPLGRSTRMNLPRSGRTVFDVTCSFMISKMWKARCHCLLSSHALLLHRVSW